ncbi:MAG: hypothetical protein H7A36_07185 [Chlamydiales bacterium]|nr:hypothetical protein [Chlamydiales bacterium]
MRRFLLILFTFPLFGLTLKDQLKEAEPGSYVVTSQDKSNTFLFIRSCDGHKLIMEEVSIPSARAPTHWKSWFECGAPGHTLWTSSQVNLDDGELVETFSFTHEGWIDRSEANAFFATLLNLPFREIPTDSRKKVGFPPKHGQEDKRKLWQPRLIVEGQEVEGAFAAFETRWPNDRTELARRHIEVYIPEGSGNFFPYWIEVDGKVTTVRLHVVDSGTKAKSPKPKLPYKKPQIIGDARQTERGVEIKLNAPDYLETFHVLAEKADDYYGRPLFLQCEKENDTLIVSIDELEEHTPYLFVVSPTEAPECTITSHQPLTINKSTNNKNS